MRKFAAMMMSKRLARRAGLWTMRFASESMHVLALGETDDVAFHRPGAVQARRLLR